MVGTAMPKAPVDEDGDSRPGENNVSPGATGSRNFEKAIFPEPNASAMQGGPGSDLGLRAGALVAFHRSRNARIGRMRIGKILEHRGIVARS